MTEEQNDFLNMIIEEIMSSGVNDLRCLFWTMTKEQLVVKYNIEGIEMFKEFKHIIAEQFGKEVQEYLTIELISKIYDRIKWLN